MHGCHPIAVLDRELRKGDIVEGFPGYSLDDYNPPAEIKAHALVVICVGNKAYHQEIVDSLDRHGFKKIIFLLDIYEIHNPFNQPPELDIDRHGYFQKNRDSLVKALDLFADDASKEIYTRCLMTHIHRRPIPLPQRPRDEQYFPADIPLGRGHNRFVCCGAYDGDTVRLLNRLKGKIQAVACFEPEPVIFKRLSDYLWKNRDAIAEEIFSWPCALFRHSGQESFISGHGLGSRIAPTGAATVQCVTLDDALPCFAPTFICMDVEGAEPAVLEGGRKLIENHRPDLGICVYHAPNHLWEIPLYLHNLNLGYQFYLRNYTTFTIETVLYAVATDT